MFFSSFFRLEQPRHNHTGLLIRTDWFWSASTQYSLTAVFFFVSFVSGSKDKVKIKREMAVQILQLKREKQRWQINKCNITNQACISVCRIVELLNSIHEWWNLHANQLRRRYNGVTQHEHTRSGVYKYEACTWAGIYMKEQWTYIVVQHKWVEHKNKFQSAFFKKNW